MFRRLKYRYKTAQEILALREAGVLTQQVCQAVRDAIQPGVTTLELDTVAQNVIEAHGGIPNFKLEPGYEHAICVSINDQIVHGIPGNRVIAPGDIVSVDAGAELNGWNGDSAFTVVVPESKHHDRHVRRENLNAVTEQSLWAGIAALLEATHVNEVGTAVERYIESQGEYGILREYVGHGIGRHMHEDPPVFNYKVRMPGPQVKPGLVICIEPMVTSGTEETFVTEDDWTVMSADGSDGAHWEHTVAVTEGGLWVLSAADNGAAGLSEFGIEPAPINA